MARTLYEKAEKYVSALTMEQKITLQTGIDNWQLMTLPHTTLPPVWLSDGPYGLRKEVTASSALGDSKSAKAVCFPPACLSACSFDRDLIKQEGAALADQCRARGVSVLLGPGVNIKRSVLGGRNFEYVSEDPFVAGELGAAFVAGVQSKNVGVSLKHFAANSCEFGRLVSDSIVDEKALREIYLSAFERIVKKQQPWTIMTSYNKLNGVYCSESKWLMTDVLRSEWGFSGMVMSDWGAVSNRVKGIAAGVDLEMPSGSLVPVSRGLEEGNLDESQLDVCCNRIVEMMQKAKARDYATCDFAEQHLLAEKVAAQSVVLLKNTCSFLPLGKKESIAVVGALAKTPHFQGGGSACVNCFKVDDLCSAISKRGIKYTYGAGYNLKGKRDVKLENDAALIAGKADKVVLVVGLTDSEESEGFDRENMSLPKNQLKLISAVLNANANTVVVLQCGAPVECSFVNGAKAALCSYMGGEAVGAACADVLYGDVNPSGRLAETWPLDESDEPSRGKFAADARKQVYSESIFVGYRYYATANKKVRFPFGYGLSYSDFSYNAARLDKDEIEKGEKVTISVDLKNQSNVAAKETVLVFVSKKCGNDFKPVRQLKGFEKLTFAPNESKTAKITLDENAFYVFDAQLEKWVCDGGEYAVQVCRDAERVVFSLPLRIVGDVETQTVENAEKYYACDVSSLSDDEFAAMSKMTLPNYTRSKNAEVTFDTTFGEMRNKFWGLVLSSVAVKIMTGGIKDKNLKRRNREMALASPFRMCMSFAKFPYDLCLSLLDLINGRGGFLSTVKQAVKFLSKPKQKENSKEEQQ